MGGGGGGVGSESYIYDGVYASCHTLSQGGIGRGKKLGKTATYILCMAPKTIS